MDVAARSPSSLLKSTVHVEIRILRECKTTPGEVVKLRTDLIDMIKDNYVSVEVGQVITGYDHLEHGQCVEAVTITDYTGPPHDTGFFSVDEMQIDAQVYFLRPEHEPDPRRRIGQLNGDDDALQARVLALPSAALKDEWDSLIYDDRLPTRLLRYLCRMLSVLKKPGLNLSTFNWNRLCLLHGPPGSGKSTLCRALAQKLSIRLGEAFSQAVLIEVNTNAMLSKYFGESGKLIGSLFGKIQSLAQSPNVLVCVVIDEVETIAGSREKASKSGECTDSIRATNQLLTALDRLRTMPNVVVLCTSNLLSAIDPAFLDRVDIKQIIPSPSPAAIYNIFRSCLNELVRASLVDAELTKFSSRSSVDTLGSSPPLAQGSTVKRIKMQVAPSSSPEKWTLVSTPDIPTFADMLICYADDPGSPAYRVWALAQKCEGFSGRSLRRLPILGLAMHTWGVDCSLDDAIHALEAAVEQELIAKALI